MKSYYKDIEENIKINPLKPGINRQEQINKLVN